MEQLAAVALVSFGTILTYGLIVAPTLVFPLLERRFDRMAREAARLDRLRKECLDFGLDRAYSDRRH